jgi:hypothetical protein
MLKRCCSHGKDLVVFQSLTAIPTSVEELDDVLTAPSQALITDLNSLDGDIMVIGSAGKMGPTLAVLAQRALEAAGSNRKVVAVSRFSDPAVQQRLDAAGVTTISADLQDSQALDSLPEPRTSFICSAPSSARPGANTRPGP